MAGCLSACVMTAATPNITVARLQRSPVVAIATTVFENLANLADPPLKPPPIA